MAFREKLAWALLATTAGGYAIYCYLLAGVTGRNGWDGPVWSIVPPLIGMGVLMALLATIGAGGAAISAPRDATAPPDERDRLVARTAQAHAYWVLTSGIGVTVALMLAGISLFQITNLLVSILVIAEIVRYASEAWHYRRGWHG
ncbi:hypothetical protein [Stakelama saccharophila]|uniref:Uncharacterized protein n=1 Tax=Stakelama saccharophila TaxID=3075605 RepID=A0ABZ0BBT5_9SPHN|nr:hypothetical protein [Stakelama sp. W311]WNO54890.1 hypothetical protein RPR59_06495 [Stakelama sp. W311]